MTKEYPWGKGTPKWTRDATLNDSDKEFTVPAGKIWDLKAIVSTLTATATVGNRLMQNVITDGTNEVIRTQRTASITASQVSIFRVTVGEGATGAVGNGFQGANVSTLDALPALILPAGYVIRVYDSAAIDAAADDLTVVLHYVEYDA